MGQRHQVYAIAKADGRYRTLAALHRQWGYGIWAIRRCQLALQIFRANASVMRQELIKAKKLDWQKEVEAEGIKERHMNSLFPIISTCLIVASGDKYLLPLSILPTKADNNDGITVFDITEPEQPRYAFVSLSESSDHAERVRRMTPMNAIEYLNVYRGRGSNKFPEDGFPEDDGFREDDFSADEEDDTRFETYSPEDKDIAREVAASPLIHAETLHRAWRTLNFNDDSRHSMQDEVEGGDDIEIDSLSRRAMREVIEKAFECSPDDLSWMEEATRLPAFPRRLGATLYEQPQLLEKPSGMSLLKLYLKDASAADLGPFSSLKASDVLDIVGVLSPGATVSLPSLPDLTIHDLEKLLETGKLRELHLGETPQVGLREVLNAMYGKGIEIFTHPSLYHLPIDLMYVSPERREEKLPRYPNGIESGFPFSQMVFMQHMAFDEGEPAGHFEALPAPQLKDGAGLAWSQSIPPPRRQGTPPGLWESTSEGPAIVPITLKDSLMTLDRFLEQIPEIVADLSSKMSFDLRGMMMGAMTGLDVATKGLALRRDKRVLPIPARLYNAYRTFGCSSAERPPLIEAMNRREWTLLALHECSYNGPGNRHQGKLPMSKLRYAFVTLADDGELVSIDVHDFIKVLLSNDVYRPVDASARAKLIESFESRLSGTYEGQKVEVSHCRLPEAAEAARLADIYRAQVEEDDRGIQAKIRLHDRKMYDE